MKEESDLKASQAAYSKQQNQIIQDFGEIKKQVINTVERKAN